MGNVRDMPSVEIQHTSTERVHRLLAECYDWLIDTYNLPLLLISFRHNLDYDNDVRGAHRVIGLMRNRAREVRHIHEPQYAGWVELLDAGR